MAGAPRIFDILISQSRLNRSAADLHGPDGIMSLFDGIDLNKLGCMRKQQLIDDFKFVVGGLD